MASWTYNGNDTETVTFTSIPGHSYSLFADDPLSAGDSQVASGTTLTLTNNTIGGMSAGEGFFTYVADNTDNVFVAAALLKFGTSGESPSFATVAYDGADTVTFTLTTISGHHYGASSATYVTGSFDIFLGDGTTQTFSQDISSYGFTAGDILLFTLEDRDDTGTAGWNDLASLLGVYGTPGTVTGTGGGGGGGGSTTPTNDSCANAEILTGLSGTVNADNTAWAGTWPTGADPLWNAFTTPHRGGGTPLWWKWTNTTGKVVDFQAKFKSVSGDIDINMGLAVGACGSLDMDPDDFVFGRETNGTMTDWDLGSDEVLDIIVKPGQTVFIEVDSYDASVTTEPPTGSPQGHFRFEWGAHDVTFYDAIIDSQLLSSDISPVFGYDNDSTRILDSIEVGGRFYAVWTMNTADGNALYAGSWNLDGSSKVVTEISSATGNWDHATDELTAFLATDGTAVWLAFSYNDHAGAYNFSCALDYVYCADYPLASEPRILDPPNVANVVIAIYKSDEFSYSFNFWNELRWSEANSDYGPVPGDPISADSPDNNNFFRMRICASPTDGGGLWVAASYCNSVREFHDELNDYPICSVGGAHGGFFCVRGSTDIWERFDVWRVKGTDFTDRVLIRRDSVSHNDNYLSFYDKTINPVFGTPETYTNGPWATGSHFDSIAPKQFWMYNDTDDGIPIIAMNKSDQIGENYRTYTNDITFQLVDGTDLYTYSHDDFSVINSDSSAYVVQTGPALYVSPVYYDALDSQDMRFVTANWETTHRYLINKIKANVSSAPELLQASNTGSSNVSSQYMSPQSDGLRNYWAFKGGYSGNVENFDLRCYNDWLTAYDPNDSDPGDDIDPTAQTQLYWQRAGWHTEVDPPFYLAMTGMNQFRKFEVKRDYWICSVGDITTPSGIGPIALGRIVFRAYQHGNA